MKLEIKKYPDPILTEKSEPISKIDSEVKELARNMVETMIVNEGVGLAAPQVGVSKRLIVVHLLKDRSQKAREELSPDVFINPRIVNKSRVTENDDEGCLSLPKVFLKIKRSKWIEFEALDISGKLIRMRVEGLAARILQHEIDHLDGILLTGRLNFIGRLKARKMIGFLKGEVAPQKKVLPRKK